MQVIIRHDDGREFEIDESSFATPGVTRLDDGSTASYQEAGFHIVGAAGGQEYHPPTPKRRQAAEGVIDG